MVSRARGEHPAVVGSSVGGVPPTETGRRFQRQSMDADLVLFDVCDW